MTKKYKIYKRTAYCDSGVDVSFGTEEDVKYWKEEEQEWIEQDFGVGDDTIEEVKINYSRRSLDQGKKLKFSDGWFIIWTIIKLKLLK